MGKENTQGGGGGKKEEREERNDKREDMYKRGRKYKVLTLKVNEYNSKI